MGGGGGGGSEGGVTSAVTLWQWCSGWEAAVGRL